MISLSMGSLESRIILPAPGAARDRRAPVYSAAVVSRSLAPLLVTLVLAGCAGKRAAPKPPLLPLAAAWKTLLGDFVTAPLATDGRRVYVATRDGAVRALDEATGAVAWKAEGLPRPPERRGRDPPRAGRGRHAVEPPAPNRRRALEDRHWCRRAPCPRSSTGIRALVAGRGPRRRRPRERAGALERRLGDRDDGRCRSPPGSRLLAGESRRDRCAAATGPTGSLAVGPPHTGGPLLAPPLGGRGPGRRLSTSAPADKRDPRGVPRQGEGGLGLAGRGLTSVTRGCCCREQVLFASYDAVLYSLRRGGNLAWRGALPSRPLSAPQPVGDYVLVACLENELVAFASDTGARAGSLRTSAEIRTPPIVAGGFVAVGLRDRSVIAYALPGSSPAPPPEPQVVPAPPGR